MLQNLTSYDTYHQTREQQKKKDRCNFVDQIISTKYKNFTKKELVKYCINNNQPKITALFDRLDEHNQQQEWVDSFNEYIQKIDEIYMYLILGQLCKEASIPE